MRARLILEYKPRTWDEQRGAMAAALPCHIKHRDDCMAAERLTLSVLNVRYRGINAMHRQRLWARMRTTPMACGQRCTWHGIRDACGMTSHSTIVESVQKWSRK